MSQKEIYKSVLTIERFKSINRAKQIICYFVIAGSIFFIVFSFYMAKCIYEMEKSMLIVLLFVIPFFCFPIIYIIVLIHQIKKMKKQNVNITNGNFKVVEDKIYDKYMLTHHDSDGDTSYKYYIFTKIYGKVSVSSFDYHSCAKDGIVYLLFGSENILSQKYNPEINEYKQNMKHIMHVYLASKCDISPELLSNLVPYNEVLGEMNYNFRINHQIEKLSKKKKIIKCKQCSKIYNRLKYSECPKCATIFKFDSTDVLYKSNWDNL